MLALDFAMSKEVKKMQLDALGSLFKGVRDMVVLTASKVNSSHDYNFRKSLREKKIRLMMVKNTLARKVLGDDGVNIDSAKDVWAGTTLIAWGADSIKDLSKGIEDVIKDSEKKEPKWKDKIKVKTAVADGQPIPFEKAKTMPTRLEAIGAVIGMILGPASYIAAALTGPASTVAGQVATISEKKEDSPAPVPAA